MSISLPFVIDRPACRHCGEPDCDGACATCANCDTPLGASLTDVSAFCSKGCWEEYEHAKYWNKPDSGACPVCGETSKHVCQAPA